MNRTAIGVTGMICGTALLAAHWNVTAGPLDPPAEAVDASGAPVSTQPSLAELEAKIDALASMSGGLTEGPWEVTFVSITPASSAVLNSVEIVPGRVLVHSVTAHRMEAALFDGPGSIDNSARVTSGDMVAHIVADPIITQGSTQLSTVVVPIDVVVEDGLHWAYRLEGDNGVLRVLYKQLDP